MRGGDDVPTLWPKFGNLAKSTPELTSLALTLLATAPIDETRALPLIFASAPDDKSLAESLAACSSPLAAEKILGAPRGHSPRKRRSTTHSSQHCCELHSAALPFDRVAALCKRNEFKNRDLPLALTIIDEKKASRFSAPHSPQPKTPTLQVKLPRPSATPKRSPGPRHLQHRHRRRGDNFRRRHSRTQALEVWSSPRKSTIASIFLPAPETSSLPSSIPSPCIRVAGENRRRNQRGRKPTSLSLRPKLLATNDPRIEKIIRVARCQTESRRLR